MRDKNLNFIQFSQSVEKQLNKKLYHFSNDRRTSVIDSPTLLEKYYLVLPRKFNEIRNLCVAVHYIEEEPLKWKLYLDLLDKVTKFDLKKQLELSLLLSSKEKMLTFLYETNKYTSHQIFGNIIGSVTESMKLIKILKKDTKVRKPQRKRGYDDKGSLRQKEKWLESFDVSLTELQNEKEKKLKYHLRTLKYLENFLEEKFLKLSEIETYLE